MPYDRSTISYGLKAVLLVAAFILMVWLVRPGGC